MAVKPISPDDVVQAKAFTLPDDVVTAFNRLIAENWNGVSSRVMLADVEAAIRLLKGYSHNTPFPPQWLDVEDVYRAQGWQVDFENPGCNGNYEAFYEFRKQSRHMLP